MESYKYKSPFNFLNPYTQDDHEYFFGRDKEVAEIFNLFKKTNLVILYGPSGSGKSSLAQCGLTNKFYDWKPILIRKGENLIDSFFDAIQLEGTNHYQDDGLFAANDCEELRKLFDEYVESSFHTVELNQRLSKLVDSLYKDIAIVPFFIFDQFEELFIENQKDDEVRKFSILLSLVTKKVSYSNVIICIQTEFFSHLIELEEYNKNILDHKCLVDDPDRDTIETIVRSLLPKYHINYIDKNDEHLFTKNNLAYCREKHEKGTLEIISRLEKFATHLPFMQIYLDRIYVLDFIKTYKDEGKKLLETGKSYDTRNYPIELEQYEVKDYGHVEDILTEYIKEINSTVINNDNRINAEVGNEAVIKFLKHFVTKKETRKDIEVELRARSTFPHQLYYSISGVEKEKIIRSIWGKNVDHGDESVGDIINELIKARIIKVRNSFLELSHNVIAQIIKKIPVEKDVHEYYVRQFESYYETYLISGKNRSHLLPDTFISKIKNEINSVVISQNASDEENNLRKQYWDKSKRAARKKFIIKSLVILVSIVAALISTTYVLINDAKMEANRLRLQNEKILREFEQKIIDSTKSRINGDMAIAAQVRKTDITKAYKELLKVRRTLDSVSYLKKKQFSQVDQLYYDLISEYNYQPFYLRSISLGKESSNRHILSIKSRVINNDSISLFSQTSDGIFSTKLKVDNSRHPTNWKSLGRKISTFCPYYSGKDIRVLYSDVKGLHDTDSEFKASTTLTTSHEFRNLKKIEQISASNFVAIDKNEEYIRTINLASKLWGTMDLSKDSISSNPKIVFLKRSTSKKDFNGNDDSLITFSYVVKDDNSNLSLLKRSIPSTKKIPYDKLTFDNNYKNIGNITNLNIDLDNNILLLSDDRNVYSFNLSKFNDSINNSFFTRINSFHQSSINSVDIDGNVVVTGSEDKMAHVYYDENALTPKDEVLSKILIGHTDAIKNVSIIKTKNKTCVLTAGEDGVINLWDISPMDIRSKHLEKAQSPLKIKFHKNKLYAGFRFSSSVPETERAFLYELNTKLNEKEIDVVGADKNSNITAFDFYKNDLIVGNDWNKVIYQSDLKSGLYKLDGTINDIKITNEAIAVATRNGLYFGQDFKSKAPLIRLLDSIQLNSVDIFWKNDNYLLLTTSDNGNIYLINPNKNGEDNYQIYNNHDDKVKDACFSEDGKYFISGSWDNTALVWKRTTSSSLKLNAPSLYQTEDQLAIKTHKSDVEDVAVRLLSDSLIIATASSDKTVSLHYIDTKKNKSEIIRIPTIIRHNYGVRSIAFGENAHIIYTADKEGYIKKWNWKWETVQKEIEKRTAEY